MRRFLPLLAVTTLFAANPNLVNIKSVYILPMTSGFDQYLANSLRNGEVLTVTTDPQTADAILTDAIGPSFERRLTELYPPPPPEKPAKAENKDGDEAEAKEEIKETSGVAHRASSFRKGRGVVFLVDRRTRRVVWSAHQLPRDYTSQGLNRAATRVSEHLKKDYAAK